MPTVTTNRKVGGSNPSGRIIKNKGFQLYGWTLFLCQIPNNLPNNTMTQNGTRYQIKPCDNLQLGQWRRVGNCNRASRNGRRRYRKNLQTHNRRNGVIFKEIFDLFFFGLYIFLRFDQNSFALVELVHLLSHLKLIYKLFFLRRYKIRSKTACLIVFSGALQNLSRIHWKSSHVQNYPLKPQESC